MTASSVTGRSRRTTRSHRSGTSHRKKKEVTAEADEAAAAKPDGEELRRKRTAYYSVSPEQRRRISSSAPLSRPKMRESTTSKSTSTRKYATGEQKKLRRKHRSSSSNKAEDTTRHSSGRDRTADYVYGASDPEPAEAGLKPDDESRSIRTGSSSRRRLPLVVEDDITPDDSISQVGMSPAIKRERSSTSSRRTSLKRSTTTPQAKLPTISEQEIVLTASPTSRRSSKRDSSTSILGSLWRRSSTSGVPTPPPKLVECLTCAADDVPSTQSAKLSCGHRMCHDCLKRLFDMSVKDPAHMPPRCCTADHIPLKHVEKLFDLKFKMLWNRKYQEYHTKNRVYCPAPKCGEWIKPSHVHTSGGRKFAQCPRCNTKVCMSCNSKMHKSRECPKDPEIAKLVAQAKEKGWQSCYNCHALVELKEGCNHMTCRCLAEFCMVCSAKWKTCDCPWFNYTQLPDSDRLREMRVPEPVQNILRRVMEAGVLGPPPERAPRQPRYQDEMNDRRRQERLDEELARRLQLATLMDPGEDEPNGRQRADMEAWGLGNAAGHFMNDDFVQNAHNVAMGAFGDPNMGRRGERSSGRRRRPRAERPPAEGLAPDFLGSESVLGVGPAAPRR